MTFKDIDNDSALNDDVKGVVIDGIKNEAEVQTLRLAPNFFLFSVQADKELRAKRLLQNEVFSEKGKFEIADTRDELEDSRYGQQVKKCDYLSDIILLNNENIPKPNRKRKSELIDKIYWSYLTRIENYAQERATSLITPSVDELCMTMAYSFSKMSSCSKRKVGAVIVEHLVAKKNDKEEGTVEERNLAMPIVVSSGFNDVPLGSHKCLYHPDYQMCYRDFLQQKHAEHIHFCPSCGKEIRIEVECQCGKKHQKFVKVCPDCKKELDLKYTCECGEKVFDMFVPGGKDSPGKLLDMCRALHAEEVALLNLIKNNIATEGLVLYTTTQPCNLCANKIVNTGIKMVVFSEPYTIKESEEILLRGGVEIKRFQGIKSNAFFRLYR